MVGQIKALLILVLAYSLPTFWHWSDVHSFFSWTVPAQHINFGGYRFHTQIPARINPISSVVYVQNHLNFTNAKASM